MQENFKLFNKFCDVLQLHTKTCIIERRCLDGSVCNQIFSETYKHSVSLGSRSQLLTPIYRVDRVPELSRSIDMQYIQTSPVHAT